MKHVARNELEFDYVIIGAGSAGCVVANRLSADPRVSVCLIEAGGSDKHPWIQIPVGYFFNFDHPRADWRFRTEPEPELNGRVLKYPRGKVVGGCSSINGMVYIRGHAADYDGWRQLGNRGWGWEDVLPYFIRSEDQVRGGNATHGVGGELAVDDLRASWEVLDVFRQAAIETGIPATEDFNSGDSEGVGYFQVTQRNGRRMSSARAFLDPVRNRRNLSVMTKAHVRRIVFAGRRATGVEFVQDGEVRTVCARREIVLSAGAVGSPHILQLSGVGEGEMLRSHGIAVLHALRGVGGGLQDHAAIRMMFKVRNTVTLNDQLHSVFSKARMGIEYALFRKGPLTIPPALVNAFVRSKPGLASPDLQYVVYPLTYDTVGEPAHRFPAFTASICLVRPESRGSVRLGSADPLAAPQIRLNFLSAQADRDAALAGMRGLRRICEAPAFGRLEPDEFRPGKALQTDGELLEGARQVTSTIFHPTSTCRMGPDDLAVVDDRLRVRGIDGLRIADASVMPTIVSGNTNAATIMIGEKASAMMIEDARLGLGETADARKAVA